MGGKTLTGGDGGLSGAAGTTSFTGGVMGTEGVGTGVMIGVGVGVGVGAIVLTAVLVESIINFCGA